MDGVTRFCFAASYAVALGLDLTRLFRPRPWLVWLGLGAGAAGLIAHTAYLAGGGLSPAVPDHALLLLAWVLAVFWLYGAAHDRGHAWGVFVLPVMLGLIALAQAVRSSRSTLPTALDWVSADRFWGALHGGLLLAAAAGVSVGFLASVMYLIQVRRLRAKADPKGFPMLSLERLERMNRRAVDAAFPPLTAGLLLGVLLMSAREAPAETWAAVKVVGTIAFWLAFLVLLYLRYAGHVPGRRVALGTVAAFGLMLVTLASSHPAVAGGWR